MDKHADTRQEPRPRKRRRGNSDADVTATTTTVTATAKSKHPDPTSEDGDAPDGAESTGRACENCRRSKLRCSRTQPCTKCVAKRAECIYEESDKKRGPRPGYIEELNGRMDTLEKLVLGQSLLFQGNADARPPTSVVGLQEALRQERERLLELAEARWDATADLGEEARRTSRAPPQPQIPLLLHPPVDPAPTPAPQHAAGGHAAAGGVRSPASSRSFVALSDVVYAQSASSFPPQDVFLQVSEFYEQHLQPWLPIMAWPETTPRLAAYDPLAVIDPWMQAVLAAASPYVDATAPEQGRYFEALRQAGTRRLFESADMDQLRVSMLLQFLLFGKGRATEVWGIGLHLTQIVVRAGLHVEDHHVTAGQHMQRRLLGFDGKAQTWMDGETVRRLFWAVFLLDRFASLYSGVPPSIDAGEVRRLLPCEGRHWHRCEPVHTRDFVPASMVSVQPFGDVNLGAYAYLIEATEVLTTVAAFAARFGGGACGVKPRPDVRLFLKEFLELDVILTNWKARLPAKYHHVSYNEDGYMDHNLTLAHMTHNTSSILLYQSPRALFGLGAPGEALHRTLLPQCAIIKHGAKEIARICTRFLFHRRYLVSPQFAFCQFAAARALLAYASWTGEAVDEEYETLFTALAESAKRWAGVGHNHERSADVSRLDNFAAMLHSRLEHDMKRPAAIDLTIPVAQLLEEAGITPSAAGDGSAQALGVSPRYASGIPAEPSPEMEHTKGGLGTSPQVLPSAAGLLQNFVGGLGDEHHTMEVHNSEHLDDVLAQMALSGPESLDARLFSWEKGPAEWPAESEAC